MAVLVLSCLVDSCYNCGMCLAIYVGAFFGMSYGVGCMVQGEWQFGQLDHPAVLPPSSPCTARHTLIPRPTW